MISVKMTVSVAALVLCVSGCVGAPGGTGADGPNLSCLSGPTRTAIAIENGSRDTGQLRPCQ